MLDSGHSSVLLPITKPHVQPWYPKGLKERLDCTNVPPLFSSGIVQCAVYPT